MRRKIRAARKFPTLPPPPHKGATRRVINTSDPTSTSGIIVLFNYNPLKPKSDQHVTSPFNITTGPNTQVMRITEMITKNEMS